MIFGAAEERNLLSHLKHIRLVRLLLRLQLLLSCDLILAPPQLPVAEVRIRPRAILLVEGILREVPQEASSLRFLLSFLFYFLTAALLPLALVAATATKIRALGTDPLPHHAAMSSHGSMVCQRVGSYKTPTFVSTVAPALDSPSFIF